MVGVALGGLLLTWVLWRAFPPVSCGSFGRLLARCDDSARAYAMLRADLKALRTLEEAYVAEHWTYTYITEDLGFIPTDGVTVSISASSDAWAASATLPALGERRGCSIYGDEGSQFGPRLIGEKKARPGKIFCTG